MVCPVGQRNHCEECGYDQPPIVSGIVGLREGSGYVFRTHLRHECDLPLAYQCGDIFRCDCGKTYECINASASGYTKTWRAT